MVAWLPGNSTYTARFDENLPVSAQDLQNYGLSLIQKEDPNFKASSGWALRYANKFMLNEAWLSFSDEGRNELPEEDRKDNLYYKFSKNIPKSFIAIPSFLPTSFLVMLFQASYG